MKFNKKLTKKVSLLCLGAVMAMSFAGCGSSESKDASADAQEDSSLPEKVIIGTQEMPNDEGIAKAQGYFEDKLGALGVDVEIQNFDSGKDVNVAIASGSIDFGLLGSCPATIAISNDYDVECIWIHDVLGSAETLVARGATNVKDVADLKGKIIATPFASTAHFSVLKALESAGVDVSDVTLLDMQPNEIYAAWENEQIDAAYVWDPVLSQLSDSTVVCTSGDMAEKGFMTSNVELVNKTFAHKYPQIVETYIECLGEAVDMYQNSTDEAIDVIAKKLEISTDDAKNQMGGSIWLSPSEQLGEAYFGTSDNKGGLVKNFSDTAQFLLEQGSIKAVPEMSVFEGAINPEYIEAVANK